MNNIILLFTLAIAILLPFHSLLTTLVNYEYIPYWKEILIAITAYLACLGILLSREKRLLLSERNNLYIFIFICVAALSTLLHPNMLSLRGFLGYILYAIVYFVSITHFRSKHIILMLNILLIIGLILGIGSITQSMLFPDLFGLTHLHYTPGGEVVRAGSFMGGSPITLGWYLALLAPVAFAQYLGETKKSLSVIYLMVSLLLLVGIVFSYSRSAYFQVFVSLSFLLVFNRKYGFRKTVLKPVLLLCSIFLAFLIYSNNYLTSDTNFLEILSRRFFSSFDLESEAIRLARWRTTLCFAFSGVNFLIGGGPGVGQLFGTFDTAEFSTLLQRLSAVTPGVTSPESYALQILAELGIFGFIAFVVLHLKFVFLGVKQIGYLKTRNVKSAAICSGVTAGLIGLSVSLILSSALTAWPVIFLFWFYCAFIQITSLALSQNVFLHIRTSQQNNHMAQNNVKSNEC